MKIPDRVRYINKRFTNRLMGLIAGRRGSPIALLHHTGRKTGREYNTPIIAAPLRNGFIFALTYGDHVDWYRNVLANDKARLTLHGRDYQLARITSVIAQEGRAAFPLLFRVMLGVMRIEGYIYMRVV
jgi:deazaflavin-dependent oxidoreductase (nitroreductase family)